MAYGDPMHRAEYALALKSLLGADGATDGLCVVAAPIQNYGGLQPAYAAGTTYGLGQFCSSGGYNYKSLTVGNVGHTPASSPTYWAILQIAPTYAAGTAYSVNDLVLSVGIHYRCIQEGTGHTPASSPTYWSTQIGQDYAAGTTYYVGDLVGANNTSYYCLIDGTVGLAPASYPSNWAPVQNPAYWQPIGNWAGSSGHMPLGIDYIESSWPSHQLSTDKWTLAIHFTQTFKGVTALQLTPDETLSSLGYQAGCSVGVSSATVKMSQFLTLQDFIGYFTAAPAGWRGSLAGSGDFTIDGTNMTTDGRVILTHFDARAHVFDQYSVSLPRYGAKYQMRISAVGGSIVRNSIAIAFYKDDNTLYKTEDINCQGFVTRHIAGRVWPYKVGLIADEANTNWWVMGVFPTANYPGVV